MFIFDLQLELIKLQRNSEKYELLKNESTVVGDKDDFTYTKVIIMVSLS